MSKDLTDRLRMESWEHSRSACAMEMGYSNANIMANAVRFVCKNPHRAQEFYSLWAGEPRTEETIPPGVIDPRRIRNTTQFNMFKIDRNFFGSMDPDQTENDQKDRIPKGLYHLVSL
jgi:hypothetical protein